MKYVQPYGIADENASYINGDPSIGRMGSIPPANAFEHPMREIVRVITANKMDPDTADLTQLMKGVRSQRTNYVEDTGLVNNLLVALDPPITAYTIGLPIRVKINVTNTGAATIDAGGGRVAVVKPSGAAMVAGDLPAGGLAEMVYDGTKFQMINFGGAGGGSGDTETILVNIPYAVDSGTVNAIVANFTPAITSLIAGSVIMVKILNTNTGLATIVVNGLPAKNVYALGGLAALPLLPGDLAAGDVVLMMYDGTRFWAAPNPNITANTTFNCANNTAIDDLFKALSRKTIQSNVTVTVKLAIANYTPFVTYHNNSARIIVEGTMRTTVPAFNDFFKTGNAPAQRAADSANNIAMLRTRYGTEIQFNNSVIGTGQMAVWHTGPGKIRFKDLLVTGANVYAGAAFGLIGGIGCQRGSACLSIGCTVWGSGSYGFWTSGGNHDCENCYATGNWTTGFYANSGGTMQLNACGGYGNDKMGCYAELNAIISHYYRSGVPGAADVPGSQFQYNGIYGCAASIFSLVSANHTNSTGNATFDMLAQDMAEITLTTASVGSSSPAFNVIGNFNALVRILA